MTSFLKKCFIPLLIVLSVSSINSAQAKEIDTWWETQSIDTMKFSRDMARNKLNEQSFDIEIEKQIQLIAQTGATHVAIGTPYDDEFLSYLKRWVAAARKHNLKVWFRGNFSGWEGWFDYTKISREQHIELTKNFINKNIDIFMDGDIFTPCPECENGGPGDPRVTNDVAGFRSFLIDEYNLTSRAFKQINKDVKTNFNSMNGDVAMLVMDRKTTNALGGIVTIDHYVASPEQLAKDIKLIALSSGGKIVLGEFGAPIPDIHGELSSEQQAKWLSKALNEIAYLNELHGVNYWVNMAGSTELWTQEGMPKQAVKELTKAFNPRTYKGTIVNEVKEPISGAILTLNNKVVATNGNGNFTINYLEIEDRKNELTIKADGYKDLTYKPIWNDAYNNIELTLIQEEEGLWFKFIRLLQTTIPFARIQIPAISAFISK